MADKPSELDPKSFINDYQYYKIVLGFPFKTMIRFQQKYGVNINDSLILLKQEGGLRRTFSGLIPRCLGEYFSNIGLLESFKYISETCKQKEFAFPMIFQIAAICLVSFAVIPFDSLSKFQQVYGSKDGRELLLYKAKLNGFTTYYNGFWAQFAAQLLGVGLKFPALFNLGESERSNEPYKMERSLLCLYSAFMTTDVLCNPLKILSLNKLVSIQPHTYSEINEQLFTEQGYQWMFRSIDTKLVYSFLRASIIIYYFDYKNVKKQQS